MSRFVVASHFQWDEYPGLRPGRIYTGAPDVSRHPLGEIHLVDGADAEATVCGLPRTAFPHNFPDLAQLGTSDPCATCRSAAPF
jgi:hypothetical protein